MINNRQNGRRRGRGGGGQGQRPGGGGHGGQRDNGNRIDSRARGNANQLYEKYKNMASDAQRQGDRVNTEYFLQFADHYFRVLMDQRVRSDDQSRRPLPVDQFDEDGDDYGDEGEPIRADEQNRGQRDDRGQRDGRDERNQREYRDERQPRAEQAPRDDRGYREDRPQRAAAEQAPREDRTYREDRPREDRRPERAPRVEAERAATAPANDVDAAAEGAPRRRGRPRRERPEEERAPANGAEGDAGLGIDRLPPALTAAPAVPSTADDGEERPRRRRGRPPAEATLG